MKTLNAKIKFYYENNGKVYLTLTRAAPEWCNLDCPTIYIESDGTDGRWPGWMLSNGLTLEDGNSDVAGLFKEFVRKSSEAFYAKYRNCYRGTNGFWNNFEQANPKLFEGQAQPA